MANLGIIALDIDGTITDQVSAIPDLTVSYLKSLVKAGWMLAFITGRSFTLAKKALQFCEFPYILAVQNGALLLKIPEKKPIYQNYLSLKMIVEIQNVCRSFQTDCVVYGGFERDDVCFFCPQHFSKEQKKEFQKRAQMTEEVWLEVGSFSELGEGNFPTFKCFGDVKTLEKIANLLEKKLDLHMPIIQDPFILGGGLAQGSQKFANKGQALKEIKRWVKNDLRVIAAGDDFNDYEMLLEADIRLVPETAPHFLKEIASEVIPSVKKEGIIQGLKKVIG